MVVQYTYDAECNQTEKWQLNRNQYYKLKCYNDGTGVMLLVL